GRVEDEGPIDAISLKDAAGKLATEFSALLVKRIYVVPGETDLCRGALRDLHRWIGFVSEVNSQICGQYRAHVVNMTGHKPTKCPDTSISAPVPPRIVDLTHSYEVEHSLPIQEEEINGVTLLGLNNAYFLPQSNKSDQKYTDVHKPT